MAQEHDQSPHDEQSQEDQQAPGGSDRRRNLFEGIEDLVGDVQGSVRVMVCHASDTAETVGGSLKDHIKETIRTVRATRDSVVMIRVNKDSLGKIDDLVESGIVNSRSEAAAFLITEGIKAREDLFSRISEKIDQIRSVKEELRLLVEDDAPDSGAPESESQPHRQTH